MYSLNNKEKIVIIPGIREISDGQLSERKKENLHKRIESNLNVNTQPDIRREFKGQPLQKSFRPSFVSARQTQMSVSISF